MDTNNLLISSNPINFISLSFDELPQGDVLIPAGAQVGDLLIVIEMEHDNGTTTTPGTTSGGLPTIGGASLTGISLGPSNNLGIYEDSGGSDDISCSFSYEILTSSDISNGTVTNGCSGGDSAIRGAYIFRYTKPITSVASAINLPNTAALVENIESTTSTTNTISVNGTTRLAGNNLNLAFLVEGPTPVLSTTMANAIALPAISGSTYKITGFYSNENITSFTNTFTESLLVLQVNALLDIN